MRNLTPTERAKGFGTYGVAAETKIEMHGRGAPHPSQEETT
ncbi:hypothetical protein [Maritimibacter alexandrii]|nr:hypothetical protein [Maritimibacter alexandrii]